VTETVSLAVQTATSMSMGSRWLRLARSALGGGGASSEPTIYRLVHHEGG
jgi:hypothetical protein